MGLGTRTERRREVTAVTGVPAPWPACSPPAHHSGKEKVFHLEKTQSGRCPSRGCTGHSPKRPARPPRLFSDLQPRAPRRFCHRVGPGPPTSRATSVPQGVPQFPPPARCGRDGLRFPGLVGSTKPHARCSQLCLAYRKYSGLLPR